MQSLPWHQLVFLSAIILGLAGRLSGASQEELNTSLQTALDARNVAAIKSALSAGADPNGTSASGILPLMGAVEDGNVEVVAILLKAGAKTNVTDPALNSSPLEYAVSWGWPEVVKLLLAHGADATARTPQGATVFFKLNEHAQLIGDFLLAAKAELHAADEEGDTALHVAAGAGRIEAVAFLLAHGAAINGQNKAGQTPLDLAMQSEKSAVRDLLLAKGGRDSSGLIALMTAMGDALKANDAAKVGQLMDANPGLVQAKDLLHAAASSCSAPVVEMLLAKGCPLNGVSADGWTALHMATVKNRLDIVRVLLAHKADPNIREPKNQYTAYDMAIISKFSDIAGALKKAGGTGKLDAGKLLKDLESDKR